VRFTRLKGQIEQVVYHSIYEASVENQGKLTEDDVEAARKAAADKLEEMGGQRVDLEGRGPRRVDAVEVDDLEIAVQRHKAEGGVSNTAIVWHCVDGQGQRFQI